MARRSAVRALEFSELEALASALEEGSISRAGRRLHMSTPAVAKRIRHLEAILGDPLVVRSTRGVVPTPLGRTTYAAARRLLDERAALMDDAGRGARHDPLRIDGARALLGTHAPRSAEDLLRETEALLSVLFHASSDGLVISSLAEGRIHEVNDAFCRLLELPRERIIGRRAVELGFWPDAAERAAVVDEVRVSGSAGPRRMTLTTGSGRPRRLEGRFRLHGLGGEDRLIVALRDASGADAAPRLVALAAELTGALASPDDAAATCVDVVARGLDVARVEVVDAGAAVVAPALRDGAVALPDGGALDHVLIDRPGFPAALVARIGRSRSLLCALAREQRRFDPPERDLLLAAANVMAAAARSGLSARRSAAAG